MTILRSIPQLPAHLIQKYWHMPRLNMHIQYESPRARKLHVVFNWQRLRRILITRYAVDIEDLPQPTSVGAIEQLERLADYYGVNPRSWVRIEAHEE